MAFRIRSFLDDDFHILFQIDQSCFPPGISYTKAELKTYIHYRDSFTLVAEKEGATRVGAGERSGKALPGSEILGFIVAERYRGTGHVITIDVRAEARRLGVGSALLHAAESALRASKCRSVQLETAVDNASALAFYKHHGYVLMTTIPHYYSNGVDAFLLEKDLLSPPPAR